MMADMKKMLTQSVTIEAFLERDDYGTPSYSPPIATPCRIQRKILVVRSLQGKDVNSSTQLYFDETVVITSNDRVTLPDEDQPPIISVTTRYDETGIIDHLLVYL